MLLSAALAGALALRAEPSAVELFAGWNWFPSPYYDGYPYGPGYYPYRCYPGVGFEQPLYGCRDDLAGRLYPYDPFWDYGYSVRYRLTADGRLLESPALSRPNLPGSAPTELKTEDQKTPWDLAVDAFLRRAPRPELGTTNGPPAAAAPTK